MKTTYKILMVSVLLGLLNFALVIAFGDKGVIELYQQRATLQHQLTESQRQEQTNLSLFRRIERLKHDPAYLEAVARKELLLVGPDELVITLPIPPAASGES